MFWISPRNLFNDNPNKISGRWKQLWENSKSDKYIDKASRESDIIIKQFNKYIYGEFRANNDEEYYLLGKIKGDKIIGNWEDKSKKLGYFGVFELLIIDDKNFKGYWMGLSNSDRNNINFDEWVWKKNS